MKICIKAAVKTEFYISSYNDRIRIYLEEVIRAVGRRTQLSLWGRKCEDIELNRKNLLILDTRSTFWEMMEDLEVDGPIYKEYIAFKKDGRAVRIISAAKPPEENMEAELFASLVSEKCAEIDAKKRMVFAAVDCDPISRNQFFQEILRAARGAVERGHFIERAHASLTSRKWMDQVDVFITDEYTSNAILAAVTGDDEPCVMRVAAENIDFYIPFSSLRPACFVPDKKSLKEAVYSIAMWIFDMGYPSPSERLCRVTAQTENPWNVAEEFEKPAKRLKKEEKNEGNENPAGA